jgi:hypothetical protein
VPPLAQVRLGRETWHKGQPVVISSLQTGTLGDKHGQDLPENGNLEVHHTGPQFRQVLCAHREGKRVSLLSPSPL